MTVFIALIRAVNVGGTGLLSMKDLTTLCHDLGFARVRTSLQSGNVVFDSALSDPEVGTMLEQSLSQKMGKPIAVLVRTAAELRATLAANPFLNASPAQVGVVFLSRTAPPDFMEHLIIPGREEVYVVNREIFVHYPEGMGRSKLKLAAAGVSTTRNLNTVATLVALATT